MKNWRKIVVATFVASMLALFGISQIGGATWTSVAADLEPGWRAYVPPSAPQPNYTGAVVTAIMILALLTACLVYAILRRWYGDETDVASAPTPGTPKHTTP